MIRIKDLHFRNLRIPDLTIAGGTTALIGRNGSGKTTLLRLLAGISRPESGLTTLNGIPMVPGKAGFVNEYPDKNALFSRVGDELASPLRFRNYSCDEVNHRVCEGARRAGLDHLLDRTINTLSGGEKVLVALLSAVISSPEVLILDEFDSHLDYDTLGQADQLIASSGSGLIVRCTQNMDLAARCGMVIVLHQGTIVHAGPPERVFDALKSTCCYPFTWRKGR
jgi:energy-coupling factor transport system ATP-binding protein